jgi:hypothetical protein
MAALDKIADVIPVAPNPVDKEIIEKMTNEEFTAQLRKVIAAIIKTNEFAYKVFLSPDAWSGFVTSLLMVGDLDNVNEFHIRSQTGSLHVGLKSYLAELVQAAEALKQSHVRSNN